MCIKLAGYPEIESGRSWSCPQSRSTPSHILELFQGWSEIPKGSELSWGLVC